MEFRWLEITNLPNSNKERFLQFRRNEVDGWTLVPTVSKTLEESVEEILGEVCDALDVKSEDE